MGNFQSSKGAQVLHEELLDSERSWVELQPFLLRRGYKLRPRYQPSWKPSWKRFWDLRGESWNREDGVHVLMWTVIDAVRISDGAKVVIKRVKTNSHELRVLQFLNSQSMRMDPRNRTIPVFDMILSPDTDETALVVMPLLMDFSTVPFRFVSEVCEAFGQFLLGLLFLHEHNIAHGDACFYNLMMDSSKVVPYGFHFARDKFEDGLFKHIRYVDRRSVAPVDYYLIDFDLSFFLSPSDDRKCMSGSMGQDRTVPEMKTGLLYDPFKSDIYQLGNVLARLDEHYEDLTMFRPLFAAMTLPNPDDRPTAVQAYNSFIEIVSSLTVDILNTRIWHKDNSAELRYRIEYCHENPPDDHDYLSSVP